MLEKLIKLYTTYMHTGVTSPLPHFVGPPGSGKSTTFQQLADLLGVKLHVVNVSRINPLGLEGLEMPDQDNSALRLLISELWTKAEEGDIYLFDEFLRGFPEVYNGLLDIFTAREVAGFQMKKVFIAAASNTTVTYDGALEDRLLHIPVADPRRSKAERGRLAQLIVDELGLLPELVNTPEMHDLLREEVLPTFDMLDRLDGSPTRVNESSTIKGSSVRKLIGQAKLRHVTSPYLRELIAENNARANIPGKRQYVFLLDGKAPSSNYYSDAKSLLDSPKLTEIQRQNLEINLQLIEMEQAKIEHTTHKEDADDNEHFND